MSLRIVITLFCAAASVYSQTDATSPSGAVAKVSLPPVAPPDSSPTAAVEPPAPAPEPNSATPKSDLALRDVAPKPAAEAPAQNRPPAADGKDTKTQADSSRHKPYVFGINDLVIVKIWNQPNLSGVFPVGTDGMLSIPIVGEIKAEGLAARELRDALTARLKECCVNNPEGEVDVQLGKNNSKHYTVFGGIGRPGEYPLDRDDFTILDAMANVGGFRDFSNKKKIYLLRGTQRFDFNYEDAIRGKHPEKNIVVQNGDRIVVPE